MHVMPGNQSKMDGKQDGGNKSITLSVLNSLFMILQIIAKQNHIEFALLPQVYHDILAPAIVEQMENMTEVPGELHSRSIDSPD